MLPHTGAVNISSGRSLGYLPLLLQKQDLPISPGRVYMNVCACVCARQSRVRLQSCVLEMQLHAAVFIMVSVMAAGNTLESDRMFFFLSSKEGCVCYVPLLSAGG